MSLLGPPFQGWGSHPRLPWPPAPRRLYLLVTCGWHPAPAPLRRPAQPSCGPPPVSGCRCSPEPSAPHGPTAARTAALQLRPPLPLQSRPGPPPSLCLRAHPFPSSARIWTSWPLSQPGPGLGTRLPFPNQASGESVHVCPGGGGSACGDAGPDAPETGRGLAQPGPPRGPCTSGGAVGGGWSSSAESAAERPGAAQPRRAAPTLCSQRVQNPRAVWVQGGPAGGAPRRLVHFTRGLLKKVDLEPGASQLMTLKTPVYP